MKISASYLSAIDKKKTIDKLNDTNIDYLHVDYMDGKFVEDKSETISDLKRILKDNKKPLDVHIMGYPTESLLNEFALFNTEYITIHLEVEKTKEFIDKIKNYGIKPGLSIKPETPIETIYPFLEDIKQVLIMSVAPGLGGQDFIPESLEKIRILKEYIAKNNYDVLISVDGGINDDNINDLKAVEADIVVVGSFITNSDNYQEQINKLK